jgi:beta-galactosidase
MRKYINPDFKHFLHGADYNPEQWIDDKSIWDEDMRLMKLANCNEMSVGIFSWAKLEPQEGVFDFSWLDEVLDRIHKAGGKVFLATPSGARPRWLAQKYPEVLRVDVNDVRNKFGARHNHCLTSPIYREKVRIINSKLAERYGNHPAVVGWHISNEYGGECYCPLCAEAYRKWLIKKYDNDIDKLNKQWWNTFWSHTYTSFDQIEPPFATGEIYRLDWRKFVTDQTADFIRNEVNAIRKYSKLPVTTNFMQFYTQLNYTVLEKEIDFISWDSYPSWHINDGECDNITMASMHALVHDAYRSFKQKPFALMESTPSMANWQSYAKLKRPGMHKLSCMQAVAHGSDTVQYFQWRKSRGNTEKMHGAVVDHLGTEHNRVFNDVKEVGQTLINIEEVLGSMPKVDVALVMDVENEWALKDCWGFQIADKKYFKTCLSFYFDLWQRGINVDVIDTTRDFDKYKLVIAPMLYSTSEKTIEKITSYVNNGGTFLSGYMLAEVNENDLCYLGGFPANNLKDVFGVWAEEVDTLYPNDRNAIVKDGVEHEVLDYCERLHVRGNAEVIGVYRDDFYANEPAIIKNKYGNGTTYYIGARDTGSLKHDLISTILSDLDIKGEIDNLPYGVTCHSREDGDDFYLFVENYNATPKTIDIGEEKLNLETKKTEGGVITLEPFGVRIYKKIK